MSLSVIAKKRKSSLNAGYGTAETRSSQVATVFHAHFIVCVGYSLLENKKLLKLAGLPVLCEFQVNRTPT